MLSPRERREKSRKQSPQLFLTQPKNYTPSGTDLTNSSSTGPREVTPQLP